MNIDVVALLLEHPFRRVLNELSSTWDALKNKLISQAQEEPEEVQTKRRGAGKKKFLGLSTNVSGNYKLRDDAQGGIPDFSISISDSGLTVPTHAEVTTPRGTVIQREDDPNIVLFTLEMKLFNFLQQWIFISLQFITDFPPDHQFVIDFPTFFAFFSESLSKSNADTLILFYEEYFGKVNRNPLSPLNYVPVSPASLSLVYGTSKSVVSLFLSSFPAVLTAFHSSSLLAIKPKIMAEQLTLLELKLFNQVPSLIYYSLFFPSLSFVPLLIPPPTSPSPPTFV